MARRVKALRQGSRKDEPGYAHREHVSKRNRTRHPTPGMRPLAPRGSKRATRWKRPYNRRMQERALSKKEQKAIRRGAMKEARKDILRIHSNILANRPWWLPRFLWVRIVAIVLEPGRGQAGE